SGRSSLLRAPCRTGSWPRRRSSSARAEAMPVSSSAATAIRISGGSDCRYGGLQLARRVGLGHRVAIALGTEPLAPVLAHVLDQRHEGATLLGQRILDSRRHLGICLALHDPLLFQGAKPQRQRARTDPL